MKWHTVVNKIAPYIVKIETPRGHGTGFLCLYNETRSLCGIATAHHVVEYADEWQQPIRIRHYESGKVVLLKESERVIFGNTETDSAVILFWSSALELPKDLIPLLPTGMSLRIGVEVGWLGFPAMEPHTLCFFSGNISARQLHRHAYLIDGVAINGVSGGPVFDTGEDDNSPRVIGAVAAYIANRATGDTLPGLAYAQDVSHFHSIASHLKSLHEANQQKKQIEQDLQPAAPPEEPNPQAQLPLVAPPSEPNPDSN